MSSDQPAKAPILSAPTHMREALRSFAAILLRLRAGVPRKCAGHLWWRRELAYSGPGHMSTRQRILLSVLAFVGSMAGGSLTSALLLNPERTAVTESFAASSDRGDVASADVRDTASAREVVVVHRHEHVSRVESAQLDQVETPAPPSPEENEAMAARRQASFAERVLRERADDAWTSASGDAALRAADAVLGASVDSVRCATTLCEVSFLHRETSDSQTLFRELRNADATGGEAFGRRVQIPNGGFRTITYFARPGQRLDVESAL
jgi:hypothetical protein